MQAGPVVRGGRGPSPKHVSWEQMEREQAAERKRREEEANQRAADLQGLLEQPGFVRYVRHLLEESGAFAQAQLFSAEVYALNAKRAFGLKIWNDMTNANPRAALLFLDLATEEKEPK